MLGPRSHPECAGGSSPYLCSTFCLSRHVSIGKGSSFLRLCHLHRNSWENTWRFSSGQWLTSQCLLTNWITPISGLRLSLAATVGPTWGGSHCHPHCSSRNIKAVAGEKAPGLGTLAAPTEDSGSVSWQLHSHRLSNPSPSSGLCRYQACALCADMCAGKTPIHSK